MDWKDKVEKLIAKANDPSVPESEAQALREAAEKIMVKRAISAAMLDFSEKLDIIITKVINVPNPYHVDKSMLLSVIAKAFRCEAIRYGQEKTATVVGYKSDIEQVEFLFANLTIQAMGGLLGVEFGRGNLTHHRKSYFLGFINAVQSRLEVFTKEAVQESPGSSVVLYDRKRAVAAEFSKEFPNIRHSVVHRGMSGYDAGHSAGMSADIGQPRFGGVRRALN